MSFRRWPLSRDDFDVAIICAKTDEVDAVEAMLDEDWEKPPASQKFTKSQGDTNHYTLGRIGSHNVVLANLGGVGKGISASSAASFRSSFHRIRLGLVVGICGGVPATISREESTEVLLGDVIISTDVMEYTLGRQQPDSFILKNTLEQSQPWIGREIPSFLSGLQTHSAYEQLTKEASKNLRDLLSKSYLRKFGYPGADNDKLHEPTHRHKHHRPDSCAICSKCQDDGDPVCGSSQTLSCDVLGCNKLVSRKRLEDFKDDSASGSAQALIESAGVPGPELLIYFGKVASGETVMKSGHHRDDIVSRLDVSAFEMEGAGVSHNFPTVIIKGVCDYADSHKHDQWQKYAAARAAACMKALLGLWRPTDAPHLGPHGKHTFEPWQHTPTSYSKSLTNIPEPTDSALGEIMDHAMSLIKKRNKPTMRSDLEKARELLIQAHGRATVHDSTLLTGVYWGLMIVEKELSCYTHSSVEEKIVHIKNAEGWSDKIAAQQLDAGRHTHIELEKYIIRGRKASLELSKQPDSEEARNSKKAAIEGIERKLGELEVKDLPRFNKHEELARQWRDCIIQGAS